MEWQTKFEVGNHKIDLEHQVFIELVKGLAEAEEQGKSRDQIRRLIAELEKYAEFHFISEENMMIDVEYPEYEDHHEHHATLLREFRRFVISFEMGKNCVLSLVDFLISWFIRHTTNEDLQLSKYISKKEA